MYPSAGYCKMTYAALVIRRVRRSLTIGFCMFALMLAGSASQQARSSAGDRTPAIKQGDWRDTIALTIFNGHLYTIEKNGALYRTDLTTDKWIQLGKPDFATTQFLFADNQNLYTIETDGSLYRVSPVNGAWSQVGQAGDWRDTSALVTLDNRLYSIEKSGALYRTDLTNGKWVQLGKPDFAATQFLFADNQNLYTIETDGSLYRVSPVNGAWSQVGQAGDWKDTTRGASFNGRIYTVELGGRLYETNPANGVWKQIGSAAYGGIQFMFAANGSLYAIDGGQIYRVNLNKPPQ